jgi:SAM-dependent methyltransferase
MATQYFVERDKCPCCTSPNLSGVYESRFDTSPIKEYLEDFYAPQGGIDFDYLKGAVYSLVECGECELIFQKHILNDDLMEKLYEHWIDPSKAMQRHLEADFPDLYCFNAQEIMQIIAYFKKVPSSLQFLDFGMGWSEWALMAKGFGCDAYGSELSRKRIEYAQSKGVKVTTGKEMPPLRFDFINTEQVLEHIPNPLETLIELRESLKPNGILKVSVPHGWDMARRLRIMDWKSPKTSRNSLNPVAPLEHINCFQRRSITKMASLAGLREINMPLKIQYGYIVNWGRPAKLIRNLALPLYRAVLRRSNYMFFTVETSR